MEHQISVIKKGSAQQLLSQSVVCFNHGTTIQNPLPRGAGDEPLFRNSKGHFWDGSNQYTDPQQWNDTEQQGFIPPEATSGRTISNRGHVMGLSMHHSKIWCLGILNILSGRNLTSGRCREDSELPLPHPPCCSSPYTGGKEYSYLWRWWTDWGIQMHRPC